MIPVILNSLELKDRDLYVYKVIDVNRNSIGEGTSSDDTEVHRDLGVKETKDLRYLVTKGVREIRPYFFEVVE